MAAGELRPVTPGVQVELVVSVREFRARDITPGLFSLTLLIPASRLASGDIFFNTRESLRAPRHYISALLKIGVFIKIMDKKHLSY